MDEISLPGSPALCAGSFTRMKLLRSTERFNPYLWIQDLSSAAIGNGKKEKVFEALE